MEAAIPKARRGRGKGPRPPPQKGIWPAAGNQSTEEMTMNIPSSSPLTLAVLTIPVLVEPRRGNQCPNKVLLLT